MADPLSAKDLVQEDALLAGRAGLVDDQEELIKDERELEQDLIDRKKLASSSRNAVSNSGLSTRRSSASIDFPPPGYSEAGSSSSHHRQNWHNSYSIQDDDEDADENGNYHDGQQGADILLKSRNTHHTPNGFSHDHHLRRTSFQANRQRGHTRRSSLIDTLLTPDNPLKAAGHLTKEELRRRYWRNIAINALFVAAWYCCSTLISIYNKWMFSPDHYNFGFPLFVTSCHMLVQFCLCSLVLSLFPRLRPVNRPSPRDYGTKAVPCGLATGLDIGLSNLSLKTITLSFYTMCKSSVLGFVLLFAFLFKLEKPTLPLIGIIGIITIGVVMMVSSETQFHLVGMLQVLTASCLSGLRWSLTQILLDKESMGMNNPFATLFWLAPIMGICLALCSIFIEGWFTILSSEFFASFERILVTTGVILIPGVIAFSMNVAEFGLIQRTSVVTLSVCGIFKEVATIFLSTVVFHDELTPINISGLCVALIGIAMYNYLKFRNYKTKEKETIAADGNGEFDERGGDPEGQFELVGEHDLDSSDESDAGGQRHGNGQGAYSSRSPQFSPSGAYDGEYGHHSETSNTRRAHFSDNPHNVLEETREMENEIEKDDMLVQIHREEEDLLDSMESKVNRGKND